MILCIQIDEKLFDLDVPNSLLTDAQDIFAKMDKDMDQGWQISRYWVENPNQKQRCQIVSDKILGSFHDEDEQTVLLMAGYILSRSPEIKHIMIDTNGDISQTEFHH